ncbi:MAG TPA: hypothetical protein VD816_11680 [Ohtaekwangia sp.]|nr:hypothetical protein [Ohtaekwangia sp.]
MSTDEIEIPSPELNDLGRAEELEKLMIGHFRILMPILSKLVTEKRRIKEFVSSMYEYKTRFITKSADYQLSDYDSYEIHEVFDKVYHRYLYGDLRGTLETEAK